VPPTVPRRCRATRASARADGWRNLAAVMGACGDLPQRVGACSNRSIELLPGLRVAEQIRAGAGAELLDPPLDVAEVKARTRLGRSFPERYHPGLDHAAAEPRGGGITSAVASPWVPRRGRARVHATARHTVEPELCPSEDGVPDGGRRSAGGRVRPSRGRGMMSSAERFSGI